MIFHHINMKCIVLVSLPLLLYASNLEYYEEYDEPTSTKTSNLTPKLINRKGQKDTTVSQKTLFNTSHGFNSNNSVRIAGQKEHYKKFISNVTNSEYNEGTEDIFDRYLSSYVLTEAKSLSYMQDKLDDSEDYIYEVSLKNKENTEEIDSENFKSNNTEFVDYIEVLNNDTKDNNYNVNWFVLEKQHCWNLPLLYGKYFKNRKPTDVFAINTRNLKEVRVTRNVKLDRKILLLRGFNEWCSTSPCFGDHTLCLFKSRYSIMCEENYRVRTPTTLQRVALVNTLNAMRNSVAAGTSIHYKHLPPAANMKQILYDADLEQMARIWLRQCLPGPALCSSLIDESVTELECVKYMNKCHKTNCSGKKCSPRECFIPALLGCLRVWFALAKTKLNATDVKCGRISRSTYTTAQLIWAETSKVGCALGSRKNGEVRVICNFAPGAPFTLHQKYYCGIISHKDVTDKFNLNKSDDITNTSLLKDFGIDLTQRVSNVKLSKHFFETTEDEEKKLTRILSGLTKIYKGGGIRYLLNDYSNGTRGFFVRLVTEYKFERNNNDECNNDYPIYVTGQPGSLCNEKGRRFFALCYEFDPTSGFALGQHLVVQERRGRRWSELNQKMPNHVNFKKERGILTIELNFEDGNLPYV